MARQIPETPNKSRTRWVVVGVVLVIVAALGGWKYYGTMMGAKYAAMAQMKMAAGGIPVEVSEVMEKPMSTTLETTGQLQAEHDVMLKSEITAKVVEVPVKDGTQVKVGTILIQLDSSTARATLAQAEANLAVSEANIGRYQRLLAIGAASQLQVDNAMAEAKLARANVQSARASLAKTQITAPFSGTAGIAQVTVGQMVQPGANLIAVTDNTHLKILLNVPEDTAQNLKENMPVSVQPDTSASTPESTETIKAVIAAVENRVDPATRTIGIKVLVEDTGGQVKSGQFVRVNLPTHTNPQALVVPDSALVAEGAETYLYTIIPGPKGVQMASRTTVTVGMRAGNEAEITSGVKAGMKVVTAGQQKMMAPVMPVMPLSPTNITRSQPVVEKLESTSGAE